MRDPQSKERLSLVSVQPDRMKEGSMESISTAAH